MRRDDLELPEHYHSGFQDPYLPPGVTDAMIDAAAIDDSELCFSCGHELRDHDTEDHAACLRPSCDCQSFEERMP